MSRVLDATIIPDGDNDTLVDTLDNCIEAGNFDQRDTDADGFGNCCDADFNQNCITVRHAGVVWPTPLARGGFELVKNKKERIRVPPRPWPLFYCCSH